MSSTLSCRSFFVTRVEGCVLSVAFCRSWRCLRAPWESGRTGKHGCRPRLGRFPTLDRRQEYATLTPRVVADHLAGKVTRDSFRCSVTTPAAWLCAISTAGLALDAPPTFTPLSRWSNIALERSRSGAAHVWIFLSRGGAATIARRLGTLLLREAMNLRGELDLASYDDCFLHRLHPKGRSVIDRATAPKRVSRSRNHVFLDPSTINQWGSVAICRPCSEFRGLKSSRSPTLPEVRATRRKNVSASRESLPCSMPNGRRRRESMLEIERSAFHRRYRDSASRFTA